MTTAAALKDNAVMASILLNKVIVNYRPLLWNEEKNNWEAISSRENIDLYNKAVAKAEEVNGGKLQTGQMVPFQTKSGFQYRVWAD